MKPNKTKRFPQRLQLPQKQPQHKQLVQLKLVQRLSTKKEIFDRCKVIYECFKEENKRKYAKS